MTKISIDVDGKTLQAQAGEMLIQVTDRNNIYIPRFCYHEKLSVAANCRMCLVEVERAPKPLPACATPVTDGMKVLTRSELAKEAQKGTMEFLLINHPLDCPVCDQGGECPLQDQAIAYGRKDSRYVEKKRAVPSADIGPLVATQMTRCIHCTRCVRFGEEIAGVMEMGAPGRGEHVKISTFLNQSIDSEVSGNMIDLCPVGALTSKPFRFVARSWELKNHNSISPHDCLGSNLNVQTLRDRVKRVLPKENPVVNDCWLADRDRYSYQGINHSSRLTEPMIKQKTGWKVVDWETALSHAAAGLETIRNSSAGSDIAGLASSSSTLEEFYLFQKLLRALGSENIDFRLQQIDFRDDGIQAGPVGSEVAVVDYSRLQSVLLIGSNIRKEQPLLALKLREGWRKRGCEIFAINSMDYDFNFDLQAKVISRASEMVSNLAFLAVHIATAKKITIPTQIQDLVGSDVPNSTFVERFLGRESNNGEGESLIILGANALQHTDASIIKSIAGWIASHSNFKLACLYPANSTAGQLANCLPGKTGKNVQEILEKGARGFILMGTEPDLDCLNAQQAINTLTKADFVIQLGSFQSDAVSQYADVLLPVATFAEAAGSYVNCEGRVQSASVAATPQGAAKPIWKVLRVLGNFTQCANFDYVSLDDVTAEIKQSHDFDNLNISNQRGEVNYATQQNHPGLANNKASIERLVDIPMYRGETLLRHADSLQSTADNPAPALHLHPEQVVVLNLEQGEEVRVESVTGKIVLPVKVNIRVPLGCAYIPAGFEQTRDIGSHVSLHIGKI